MELTHKDGDRYVQQYRAGDVIWINDDVPNPIKKIMVVFMTTDIITERD